MKHPAITVIVAAIGLVSGAGALADPMSRAEYEFARKNIASDYQTAKTGCEPMDGNVKDICEVDVKGRQEVAQAELEAARAPGSKTLYDLRIVRARADYAVAKQKCADTTGIAWNTCVNGSEAVSAAARIDAAAQLKAAEVSDAAKARAGQGAGAPTDTAAAKRSSDYSTARERCETFVGGTRDLCLSEAKRHYGMS